MKYTNDWYSYDPTGMILKIEFYSDNDGKPDTVLYTYENVAPKITETGIWYSYGGLRNFELYYFEVDLDPCSEVTDGWVSIQSTFCPSGGWFQWMNSPDGDKKMYQFHDDWVFRIDDVSFMLTDGKQADPDLECDGELSWNDISPGATVTGDFVVRNNGAAGSILHWKIESYPTDWGTNWTFTPNASILTIGADWITVDVEVIAPDDPNEEFTGEVKIVNVMDSSDSCTIDVSLATPRNKVFIFNFPLLSWLFERFPYAFPILRQLLEL